MYSSTIYIKIRAVLGFIRRAVKGASHDYTQGSIRTAVLLLAIPMILEMMMESIFAVVDIYFVGRTDHAQQAVATVVLTESVLTILYSAAIALSIGATAVVARRIGEKNSSEAAHSGAQAILLGVLVAVLAGIAGILFAPHILGLMGASPAVIGIGTVYTRIIFGGSLAICLLFLINGIFRGAGNASIAMWSLWIANGFNIVLCPLLIHYYGLTGAAVATTTGRAAGVAYQLFHLLRGKGIIRLKRIHFLPEWKILRSIFSISWVGFLQFFIGSASWIFMARIMTHFHDDAAIAGYGLAVRVMMFFLLPAWGMSNAAATLVGQNLGAGHPLRAEQCVWKTAKYNTLFMGAVTILFLFFAEPIVRFMNKDLSVDHFAILALRTISLGYILFGIGMVLTNAFNGAGDSRTPTIINLFCFWALQIPLAYLLAISLGFGPRGVYIAILVAESSVTLSAILMFRKGRWKLVKV
jgi:putative MATE family efflux protein